MKAFFYSFVLIVMSQYAFSAGEWFYYKEYPWVYDNVTEDWLYLRGEGDGKIYAYRASTKEWEEFNNQDKDKSWEEKYEVWVQNPKPYGGLDVLSMVKDAKDNGASELRLLDYNISDLTPLAELYNLRELGLGDNNISDLTPLANLSNLEVLGISDNKVTDLSPLSGLPSLERLHIGNNKIEDLSPLSGMKNLSVLWAYFNKVTDIFPITSLTNLKVLNLMSNNIPASQRTMLEGALTSTNISW